MSRGERSRRRVTSTWSMTASKIFSRGEYWKPIVTSTAWFLRYLWDLSQRRLLRRLVAVEMALRQRHDARAVRRAAGRHDQQHVVAAHDDAAGGDLLDRAAPRPRAARAGAALRSSAGAAGFHAPILPASR